MDVKQCNHGVNSASELFKPPHTPRWQEVGPDVERLVVHLKAAEDAVQG